MHDMSRAIVSPPGITNKAVQSISVTAMQKYEERKDCIPLRIVKVEG